MELSEETTYDATIAEVFAVEADEAEYLTRFAEGGDRDVEMLECGPDGDGWIPLIGGKIANWAKGDVGGQIRREFVSTRRRSAERR